MYNKRKNKVWIVVLVAVLVFILLGVLFLRWVFSDDDEDEDEEVVVGLVYDEEDYGDGTYEEEDEDDDEIVHERPEDKGSDTTWTVMLYMCGSDLESKYASATKNLNEVFYSDISDKVNILVETGGSKSWNMNELAEEFPDYYDTVDPDTLGFYRIDNNGIKLEKTEPLLSMGDPDNLKDYILWAKENYPADKYMLLLWDHGGGSTRGVCFDDLFGDDCLTLPDIKKAIRGANVPFEVVGFDACLMASLETAEAMQGYVHYMVASEDIVPGSGWNYTDFVNYLCEDTSIDGLQLGKQIADGYMEKCRENDRDAMATLSVADLTRLPVLSAAYRNISGEFVMSTQDPERLRTVMQGASKAETFGSNSDSEGYTNMMDLGDLIEQTGSVLNRNAENVKKALQDVVKYEVHGNSRNSSNGLSVFYPIDVDEDDIDDYKKYSNNPAFSEYANILIGNWDSLEWEKEWEEAWKEAYLNNEIKEGKYDYYFNNGQSIAADYNEELPEDYYESISGLSPVQKEDYNLKFTQAPDKDGYYKLKITSGLDMVSAVDFLLYYEDPDSGMYIYLGSDNSLYGDYEKGEFKEQFEGTWMSIGGEFVYAELIEENDDYNLYSIPILLNGEKKYIKAIYDFDKQKFIILGAYDGIDGDSGSSGRDVRKLKKGDKVQFLFYVYDPENESEDEEDEDDMIPLGGITWKDNTVMEDKEFFDAELVYMFKIMSVFGDEDYSESIYMTVKDGEISAST